MAKTAFQTIGLTAKLHMAEKERVLAPIVDVLRKTGATIRVDPTTAGGISCTNGLQPIGLVSELDLIVVVGGDGTILRTIRELNPGSVPVVAVNAGSVGFLSEVALSDAATELPLLLEGGGFTEERSCIDIVVERGPERICECTALNEAVIAQGSISRVLDLKASIGDQFLALYNADGLIIATPTGSTAYSLAAGGPVVHPTVSALILTPINPHSFTQKPIVLPGNETIDVLITRSEAIGYTNSTVGLTIDGQTYYELQAGDRVKVRTGHSVRFLRRTKDAFYRALRSKLKWGEGHEA